MINFIRDLSGRVPALRALLGIPLVRQIWQVISGQHRVNKKYRAYQKKRIIDRKSLYVTEPCLELLSFVTSVYNTNPEYLEYLAKSIFKQDFGTEFEWFILDNGSSSDETKDCIRRIAEHRCVRMQRVEKNLGIIGGMRLCLEHSKGRYVLPVDSDDYLYQDCARIVTWYIQHENYPPVLYSDEDKLYRKTTQDAYFKPDWDPVLFSNSCFIAHLCAIDRNLALKLNIYNDTETEGSHDWDTVTRFTGQGYTPVHIPEVLYSWRMHHQSTAMNLKSKPFVLESQKRVLTKFLDAQSNPGLYYLDKNPLFGDRPSWWIRRQHCQPRPITTVIFEDEEADKKAVIELDKDIPHSCFRLATSGGLDGLKKIASDAAKSDGFIHLMSHQVSIEGEEWPWEAMTIFELFPETVMVGGNVCKDKNVINNGCYRIYAYDSGFGAEIVSDPGYFAHRWRQRSVYAVSACHTVVDAGYLSETLDQIVDTPALPECLGHWLSAIASRHGRRVVYSPFFNAKLNDKSYLNEITENEEFYVMFGQDEINNRMQIFQE